MRKKLLVLILAAVLLLAAACGAQPEESAPEQTGMAVNTAEATPDPTPIPTPEPTPTPTPEPTPTPDPTLKEGMDGEEVNNLQMRLAELGYLNITEPTSYYGSITTNAVRLFQEQNSLAADGIAGQQTLDVLYSDAAQECELPLAGVLIGLDPGHQAKGNSGQEPVSPGSGETKAKVSSGTAGVSSGVDEHVVNLKVGLKLRDLLEAQGATVLMTRESGDVDISNSARATMMNDAGADLVLRLHCNGIDDSSVQGAFILVPSNGITSDINAESKKAAEYILQAFIDETGANNRGISERSDQTGFNWSTVPVCNIEMGHMSNPSEDERLVSDDYQAECARGLCNGIVKYFQNK